MQLKESPYERVAGLLIALLILVGMTVLVLFLLWLARSALQSNRTVSVELVEEFGGRQDAALGTARELEPPGADQLEPETPQLTDALAAVTDAVSSQRAALDELDSLDPAQGAGSSRGDARALGTGGEGTEDVVPRWERWEIRFASTSLDAYAQQLDFFGIELGALGGGKPDVDYALKVSQEQPQTRTGPGAKEDRLHFSWKTGTLREFDRQLLAKAGVTATGRIVAQFYPPDVENQLALLERQRAGKRELKEIAKTVFGVKSAGGKHEFYVADQQYRPQP